MNLDNKRLLDSPADYSYNRIDSDSRKRVTIIMDKKHKRFLEDFAHEKRISQYEALYDLFEKCMQL